MDAFEVEIQKQIDAGHLDKNDMPLVLAAIRRWHVDGVWQTWTKLGQVWRHWGSG